MTYEFNTWLKELDRRPANRYGVRRTSTSAAEYETVLDETALDAWLDRGSLAAADYFAFDTETTSLDYMQARVVGVSFACETGRAAYVPVAHDYVSVRRCSSGSITVLEKLQAAARRAPSMPSSATTSSTTAACSSITTMLHRRASPSTRCSSPTSTTVPVHGTISIPSRSKYLGRRHDSLRGRRRQGRQADTVFNEVALEQATPYAAEDAEVCLRLHDTLYPRLDRHRPKLGDPCTTTSRCRWCAVLSDIERRGVLVDA